MPSLESARLRTSLIFGLVAELIGDLEEEAHVLDARDLEAQHRQDDVRRIEDRQRRVVEVGGAVDDDELVSCAERLQDVLHARRRDHLGHLRRGRREQDADARRMVDDEGVDRLQLTRFELRHEVGDRLVLRVEVEQDPDVAELEGAVHQDDRLPSSVAAATARLTAIVVRPTPPFGLKIAMIWPGLAVVGRAGRAAGRPGHHRHRVIRLCFSRSRV